MVIDNGWRVESDETKSWYRYERGVYGNEAVPIPVDPEEQMQHQRWELNPVKIQVMHVMKCPLWKLQGTKKSVLRSSEGLKALVHIKQRATTTTTNSRRQQPPALLMAATAIATATVAAIRMTRMPYRTYVFSRSFVFFKPSPPPTEDGSSSGEDNNNNNSCRTCNERGKQCEECYWKNWYSQQDPTVVLGYKRTTAGTPPEYRHQFYYYRPPHREMAAEVEPPPPRYNYKQGWLVQQSNNNNRRRSNN